MATRILGARARRKKKAQYPAHRHGRVAQDHVGARVRGQLLQREQDPEAGHVTVGDPAQVHGNAACARRQLRHRAADGLRRRDVKVTGQPDRGTGITITADIDPQAEVFVPGHQHPQVGGSGRRAMMYLFRSYSSHAGRRICRRIWVSLRPVRIWTRSHTWFTTHSPRPPPRSAGSGRSRPVTGSSMWPLSRTWQMTSLEVAQMASVPGPLVWARVLAASSPTAMTRSRTRRSGSPARSACPVMKARTRARSLR